jgi:hypothetical protein
MAKRRPIPNGGDDPYKRADRGKFAKGNRGGPGNPLAGRLNVLREKFIASVEKRRGIEKCVDALMTALEGKPLTYGQAAAIRELLDRSGCSAASMIDERKVEVDEQAMEKLAEIEGLDE